MKYEGVNWLEEMSNGEILSVWPRRNVDYSVSLNDNV